MKSTDDAAAREANAVEEKSEREPIAGKRKPYVYLSERMGKWWMDPEMIFFVVFIFGAILLWNYI
jgi:hypothetical protein